MLANVQASATKGQQCAKAVATCSQAWVKTRARPSTSYKTWDSPINMKEKTAG